MGKKFAVLAGCNYPSTEFKLHGSINDVVGMAELLVDRFGFHPSNVQLLTDEFVPGFISAFPTALFPTGENIKAELNKMVTKAERGDVLFFHFSGHGTIISSIEPGQAFRQIEAIVPCDLNVITDMDLRKLIRQLPEGASFTILSDSCHSGGLIDKDKEIIGPYTVHKLIQPIRRTKYSPKFLSGGIIFQALSLIPTAIDVASSAVSIFQHIFKKEASLKFSNQGERDLSRSLDENEGILLSGCRANEISGDVAASDSVGGVAYGAFTAAVRRVLDLNSGVLTNRDLVMKANEVLKEYGFEQNACLYCSEENADAPFLGK
ncbi:hypothetical protein PTKIN_Ptkin16aG0057900 [Pterospermum kingtungense]